MTSPGFYSTDLCKLCYIYTRLMQVLKSPLKKTAAEQTVYPLMLSLLASSWLLPNQGLASEFPPPDDIPEEILRTEIITEARSPVDGELLTAAEYAELQAQLEAGPPIEPELSPKVRRTIGLLRLRKIIRTFFPFLLR